ncbi:MAG: sigma-54 dependent transcriptional regulator [Planctomycetota bacterium]|nr:sigma-54 dependent transcriptional regulator [Planctomycetota bacterium]MDA1213099.1 sigma-54 dependent transcriptional regulator [Planctomycetota bacterium]
MNPEKTESPDLSSIKVSVLVVDDDEAHAEAVAESLGRVGYDCTIATTGKRGASLIESENFDVIVTDLMMDEVDGLEILRKAKEELPNAEVILLTGHATYKSALDAGQGGAYTYLIKPLDINELRHAVDKASTRVRLIRRNAELNRRLDEKFGFEGVIGNSPAMQKILARLKQIAPTDTTVLIQGDSGTGKELVARALHQNSERKTKPFVPLNISALPSSILESELFGHEQGAFTGAMGKRVGKFEHANGGTLFLDEVGEMPMETQIKLLRVLEERKITRLGMNDEIDINVRLVAATNADLKEMVKSGKFREDLYYRLSVVNILLPPLRERRGDIPLLMEHFLREHSKRLGKDVTGITKPARHALMIYNWPGNIRELKNMVEGMMVLDMDGVLDVDDLPEEIAPPETNASDTRFVEESTSSDFLVGKTLHDVERYYIQKALELTSGNRAEAATLLGIGERTLYRKIKEYDLDH